MESGYIYKITCIPTGKHYVGQAKEYKYKNGKPYKYGIKGRWNDHVSSSTASLCSTAFSEAIWQYGKEAFQLEELEKANLQSLDALEAKWIEYFDCVVPKGYNLMRHSQNKHRAESNLNEFFVDKVNNAVLRKIYKGTEQKLVYATLSMKDGTTRRIVFGQNQNDSFDDAWAAANDFVASLGCSYHEDKSHNTDPLIRYASKLEELSTKNITKIRITNASSLIAVYITTSDMTSWKEQIRICFGGKTIPKENAYELAKQFVAQIPNLEKIVLQDICQSPQQVAASMGETSP